MRTPQCPANAKPTSAPSGAGLTRIDRLMICEMLSNSRDKLVPLTAETEIGGASLRQILEFAGAELYLAVNPRTPSEKMYVSLMVRAHQAAITCFNNAEKSKFGSTAFELHMKYALKATDTFIALFERFERCRSENVKEMVRNPTIDFDDAESGSRGEVPIANGRKKPDGNGSRKAGHTNGQHP
jgi:hypothetical protein